MASTTSSDVLPTGCRIFTSVPDLFFIPEFPRSRPLEFGALEQRDLATGRESEPVTDNPPVVPQKTHRFLGVRGPGVDPGGVDPRRPRQPSGMGDVRVRLLLRLHHALVLHLHLRSQSEQHLALPGCGLSFRGRGLLPQRGGGFGVHHLSEREVVSAAC